MKPSWLTAVFGALALLGGVLKVIPGPDWLKSIGDALIAAGSGGGLVSATRDIRKTHAVVENAVRTLGIRQEDPRA